MPTLPTKHYNILQFVGYELRHMVQEASDADSVGMPMMDDAYLRDLTPDQREELGAKLMDLAKWILHI